jgi:ABC-2 type transport system permease protein
MRELISLIKVNLNVNFGISMFKYKFFKQKKDIWQLFIFIIAMLSLIPTYILYIKAVEGFYRGFEYINQQGLVLLLGFLFTQLIIFIFGILYVMGKFYFSDDLKILIPLPLKPNKILIAKFITLLVNEYITVLPFILPVFFIYGLNASQGLLYWIYSLIVFIVLPVIPLGLSTILVMLFMRVTNIKGKRDLLRIIGFIVMIVVIIAIQFSIQSMDNNVEEGQQQDYIAQIAAQNDVLVKRMGTVFPPSIWASLALTRANSISGLLYLALLVGTSILVFFLMVLIGEKVFYEGIIGGQETVTRKKKVSEVELKKKVSKTSHPIIAILMRDMKILIRTPIFAMNSIGSVIIIPIALAIPLITSRETLEIVANLYTMDNLTIVNFVLVGFIIFIGATNGVASTTFSREGKGFWISRVIPIKVEDYLLGKILSGLLVQLLAVVVILVSLSFLVKLHISTILAVSILGLLGSIPITEGSMLIDIIRPLLDWDNPQKVMKQNLNVVFSMILGLVFILLLGLAVFVLFLIKLQSIIVYIIMTTILIGLSIALFFVLAPITANRLKNIE